MTQPETRTVSSMELVTILAADYADLLDCRLQLTELNALRSAFEVPPRSRISRDPEVTAFVADQLGKVPIPAIHRGCLSCFGETRTRDPKSICRYWDHLRRVAARQSAAGLVPTIPRDFG